MPHLPPLIIAVLITAYWGRVMRLVYKIRRRTGRGANFAPPERTGRLLRFIWTPLVGAWMAQPYAAGLIAREDLPAGLRPASVWPVVAWVAVGVALLAFAATLACWKRMGKAWRMGIDPAEKNQLIVTGPYAYVRHPIYALSSLLMVCTLIVVPSPGMLLTAAIHLALLQWEARREERHMAAHHGQAYLHYCQRVGRFLPRSMTPYEPGTRVAESHRSV